MQNPLYRHTCRTRWKSGIHKLSICRKLQKHNHTLPTQPSPMACPANGPIFFTPYPTLQTSYSHLSKPLDATLFLPSQEESILALPTHLGGLGLINPAEVSHHEFKSSEYVTAPLVTLIMSQQQDVTHEAIHHQQVAKANVRTSRKSHLATNANQLKERLPPCLKWAMELASEKGASSWLTALPITEHGFILHKGAFRDALCLRYNWQPTHLPKSCVCGHSFTVDHALSCPTEGLPTV